MNEILFGGTHTRDKACLKEIARFSLFARKPICILHIIMLCLLPLVIVLHSLGFYDGNNTIYVMYGFLGFFFLFIGLLYYASTSLQYKRQMEQTGGKDIVITVQVTESTLIHSASTGSVTEVNFSAFKSVEQSKNFVVIFSKTKQMYVIDKRKFTNGTPEELVTFLKSKGVK